MMGFRKPMDYNSVHHQIHMSGVELCSSRNDGFVTWEIKKDLYKLKFLLDEIIKDSPSYADEQVFLDKQQKVKMWRTLNEM